MDISAITQYKSAVDSYLLSYLRSRGKAAVNAHEIDLIGKLVQFVGAGKTIRGCLVVFGYTMFGHKNMEEALPVAAAAELFHSGFLIHDDIMDEDQLRRGKPAIHAQYANTVVPPSEHYGKSMGINSGDYCFFLGYQLLALDPTATCAIAHIFSQEFPKVVAAQMADVSGTYETKIFSEEEIIDIYRYKTARYTFSLPLCVGAQLVGTSEKILDTLETLGEHIGLLFQIHDDELSAFGDSARTGKPVGNDRAARKQTLLHHCLQMEYGDKNFAQMSDDEYKTIYEKSTTQDKIATLKTSFSEKVSTSIEMLPVSASVKKTLWSLAEFVQTREN